MLTKTAGTGIFDRFWPRWVLGSAVALAMLVAGYLLGLQEPGLSAWVHASTAALAVAFSIVVSLVLGFVLYTYRRMSGHAAALNVSERRLASVLENLPGIAFRCDYSPGWAAEFFSAGCKDLSGYAREDFESWRVNWGDLIHPEDRDRIWQEIENGDGTFESEYRIYTRDGELKWMWTRGRVRTESHARAPWKSDAPTRWLEGVIVEVTEGKAAEEAERAAQREASQLRESLAQVDRLSMLGDMAAGIAHEINQPLGAISMYAQSGIRFLHQRPLKRDKLTLALEKLSEQAHRAAAIVQQMRWMASQNQSRFVETDCNRLVAEVATLANSEAHLRGIEIEMDLCPNPCICECIPIQIQQVAFNLLRNAMASMQGISCRNGYHIYLSTRCTDSQFIVSVADMGTRISDDMAPELFVPSQSEAASAHVGLSICNGIIAAHHGEVDFMNNDMGGATFCFSIPRAEMH